REIYIANRSIIGQLVLNNQGNEEVAKDVMQESMLAFYESVRDGKFRHQSSISTYLFSIARFNWLNRLKKAKKESQKLLQEHQEQKMEWELPHFPEQGSQEVLADLFNHLGADCQRVLLASIYEGIDMKKIAIRMNYENEQVARNKKYRCLKQLKALIKEHPSLLQQIIPS
ncbi:MAG: sigma-70 family RNA polymerase sigma factor, partial [Bacteroidota bacterium]